MKKLKHTINNSILASSSYGAALSCVSGCLGPSVFPFVMIMIIILTQTSCSNLRYIDDDQSLYTGSSVEIESEEPVKDLKEIESEILSVIRPQPNGKFLIWRPRLWFYNIAGSPGESGIGNWVKNRLGRPPVLFEEVDTERTVRLINNRLFNMGHFDAEINYRLIERPKRTGIRFRIDIKAPYKIGDIYLEPGNSSLLEYISKSMDESLLERGQTYSLTMLKSERERIDDYLKELGYFYFHADYLLFLADSTAGNREIDLSLSIKPAAPAIALEKYTIRNVYIDTEPTPARAGADEDAGFTDTGNGLFMRSGDDFLRLSTIENAVFLEKDKIYRNTDHRLTINHLMGLGVFKFLNIRFERVTGEKDNLLDANVILTPMEKKNISTELRWVSKSNSFTGPGLTGSFSNRNFLGGAENFSISMEGSFESLLGQGGVNSAEVGIASELSIPRLLFPYRISGVSPRFLPETKMTLTFNHRNRTDAFSLSSLKSQFGYHWNPSRSIQHRFNPFAFNVFSLGKLSNEFQRLFSGEMILRRGLFGQFLLGSDYSFLYNSRLDNPGKHEWYFNFNIDLSGNFAWLISKYIGKGKSGENGEYKLLNHSFSQFAKTDFDLRYYVETGSRSRIATRLFAGIGKPYGNSETLPYTKLFTIGGSNSIRAFQPRSLGPGSYASPDTLVSTLNIYQSGEIKLEMNIEYRYDISRIIKAAIFADAGNIWNLKEREKVPGGMFRKDDFAGQIALGTGVGLRMDFTFFLLRLDLAFPLAVPSIKSGGYFENIRPFESSWRKDNLVLNLAIGYPF